RRPHLARRPPGPVARADEPRSRRHRRDARLLRPPPPALNDRARFCNGTGFGTPRVSTGTRAQRVSKGPWAQGLTAASARSSARLWSACCRARFHDLISRSLLARLFLDLGPRDPDAVRLVEALRLGLLAAEVDLHRQEDGGRRGDEHVRRGRGE